VTIYLKIHPDDPRVMDYVLLPPVIMAAINGEMPPCEPCNRMDVVNRYLYTCNSKEEKVRILALFLKHAIEPIKNTFAYLMFEMMVLYSEIVYRKNVEATVYGNVAKEGCWNIRYKIDRLYSSKIPLACEKIAENLQLPTYAVDDLIYIEFTDFYMASQKPPMEYLPMIDAEILNTHIEGITDIEKAEIRLIKRDIRTPDGRIIRRDHPEYEEWSYRTLDADDYVIDTIGSNLMDILSMKYVDPIHTFTNDIHEMNEIYGIEVARKAISYETMEVLSTAATVDVRHVDLLADTMTCYGLLQKIDRSGAKTTESGPLHLASFEETTTNLCNAAAFSQVDNMTGVSANVMHGQNVKTGTGLFDLILDTETLMAYAPAPVVKKTDIGILQGVSCGREYAQIDETTFNFNYIL